MEVPPHAPRALAGPRLPHRRTKAQRDRQRGHSPANSLSSSPEPELWPRPQRKRKRRKREESAGVPEEDLIDGFCISSYGSLEAMQKEVSVDSVPLEDSYSKRPPGKRKRSDGASSEDPGASETPLESWGQRRQKRHCSRTMVVAEGSRPSGPEIAASQQCLDAGYICDGESSADEQMASDDLAVSFTISTSTASPPLSGGRLRLMVLSQISGLGRSCERSQEPEADFIQPQPRPSPPSHDPPQEATPSQAPQGVESAAGSSRGSVSKRVSAPQVCERSSTPSLPPPGIPPVLRPPSHQRMDLFPNSQGLPPPPPLMQVPGHLPAAVLSEHPGMGLEMGSRFVPAPGAAADIGAAIRPMYQFHQHNHQHTHQHTHQHFTPYPPNFEKYPGKIENLYRQSASTFEKYPGKIENLYRQSASTFYPPFSPVITALPPVLPSSVSFGSMQGAFQPKSTSSELASRCSVPPPIIHKTPQMTEQFKPRRSGRWCAMHVRVAYMILRHQERLKLAHGTPHKAEFRGDLLCLNPELARTPSLMPGAVSHPSGQFQVVSSAASFLPPSAPIDHFIRHPGFSPLASLTNGAFGGLGNPSYSPAAIFNHKDSPLGHSFPGPHDPWNRLHRTPPSFPGAQDPHGAHLKEEKERELLYSRLAPRVSPLATQRLSAGDSRGSPYVRPGSSSDTKPRLTPDHPSKVKVKEEPELLTFEVGRSPLPAIHLPHPSPPFERLRGAFLGEQYPNALEAWRDVYRRADPPPHRLYDHREERAHILREDFERARFYGLPSHVSMQPGALYPHPGTGLLSKTPPINLLSAPPPLISSGRPGSPPRRDRDCR